MDRHYIREHAVVDRYLDDKLTEAEVAAFEAFYLSDPETLAELELTAKLKEGLRECAQRGDLETPAAASGSLMAFLRSPQYAAAATALLVGSLAFSALLMQRDPAERIYADTRLIPVYTTRSQAPMVLRAPGVDALRILLVDPGIEPYDTYRATITRRDGDAIAEVWQAGGLEPGYEDYLALTVPGRVLVRGDYDIRIQGQRPGGAFAETNRIPLRVE